MPSALPTMTVGMMARPSRPSVRFTAFEVPTMTKKVRTMKPTEISTRYVKVCGMTPPELAPRRTPIDAVRSLHRATNQHDLEAIVAHFAHDYELEDPVRPDRSFRGADQVRRNWASLLAAMPDLALDERRLVADGSTVWTEIAIRGHRSDGMEQVLRGVMIFHVPSGIIKSGTFYLAPVIHDGIDADAAVHLVAEGPPP